MTPLPSLSLLTTLLRARLLRLFLRRGLPLLSVMLLLPKRRSSPVRPLRMRMSLLSLRRFVRNVVVRHTAALGVPAMSVPGRNALVALCVLVIGLGMLEDDVPGVYEAGEVAEAAEGDVDDGVGGADADFDPDYAVGHC